MTYFFIAAAVGFVLMLCVTVQAIEALTATQYLIRKAAQEDAGFRAQVAKRRSIQVAVILLIPTVIACLLVQAFATGSMLWGYWFGFVLAMLLNIPRYQGKRPENAEKFRNSYVDCFSDFVPEVIETPEIEEEPDDTDDEDDQVVPVSRPR